VLAHIGPATMLLGGESEAAQYSLSLPLLVYRSLSPCKAAVHSAAVGTASIGTMVRSCSMKVRRVHLHGTFTKLCIRLCAGSLWGSVTWFLPGVIRPLHVCTTKLRVERAKRESVECTFRELGIPSP